MSVYTEAGTGVKGVLESNKLSKVALGLDMIIMFASLALLLINALSNIGSLLYAVAFWGFLAGLVLTFANLKTQMLYIGLYGYALVNIINFFRALFTRWAGFNWFALIAIVIFGGLGYIVMKQE